MAESNSQATRCPCGFFGSAQTLGLCSKCYNEREQNRAALLASDSASSNVGPRASHTSVPAVPGDSISDRPARESSSFQTHSSNFNQASSNNSSSSSSTGVNNSCSSSGVNSCKTGVNNSCSSSGVNSCKTVVNNSSSSGVSSSSNGISSAVNSVSSCSVNSSVSSCSINSSVGSCSIDSCSSVSASSSCTNVSASSSACSMHSNYSDVGEDQHSDMSGHAVNEGQQVSGEGNNKQRGLKRKLDEGSATNAGVETSTSSSAEVRVDGDISSEVEGVKRMKEDNASEHELTPRCEQKNKSRCFQCNRKLTLAHQEMGKCQCEYIYCALHRLPEQHACSFDHKEHGRAEQRSKMITFRKNVGTSLKRLDQSEDS